MSGASNSADPWFHAMVGQWWTLRPSDVGVVGRGDKTARYLDRVATLFRPSAQQLQARLIRNFKEE